MFRRLVMLTITLLIAGCANRSIVLRDQTLSVENNLGARQTLEETAEKAALSARVWVEVLWRDGIVPHNGPSSRHRVDGIPPEGRYRIIAYQEAVGEVPLRISEITFSYPESRGQRGWADNVLSGAAAGIIAVGIVTAPIWGPIYLASQPDKLPAGAHVWVEDSESGEYVAGSVPWTAARLGIDRTMRGVARQSSDQARLSGSDLRWVPSDRGFATSVNCVSGGVRRWVREGDCD